MRPIAFLVLLLPLIVGITNSCAQDDSLTRDKEPFADEYCLHLKPGTDASRVNRIQNPVLKKTAENLLSGRLQESGRLIVCEPYEPVQDLSKRLKASAYSQFENPTGIYFSTGEQVVVCVGPVVGQSLSLRVKDFGTVDSDVRYPLKAGINLITMKGSGLGYISYFTQEYRTAPKIQASVLGGQLNGVFKSSFQNNDEWKRLLAGAVTDVVDMLGKKVHLVFPVKELRESCPERGLELLGLYDRIIGQQQEILGLVKYDRVPKNHMFGRVIWKGYMHADGIGAAFHNGTMRHIAAPDQIATNAWGIAHEFGHVNQVRPGMRWVSTTEVTNNIFSMWTNYLLSPASLRLEREVIDGGDGRVAGGRFNAYLNSAIVAGDPWLCQKGPDKMTGYENGGDHFVKLCPFWQLQLYFAVAGCGNPDIYPDVFEMVRNTDQSGQSNGQLQLQFMRNMCDAAKLDLTGFFVKTGMLKPIDRELDDYTRGRMTITQSDCDNLIRYASKYPKPNSPVIYYISANSVDAYKSRLPVSGTVNVGVSGTEAFRLIDHAQWKNVVAFECYHDERLLHVAMAGTGSTDNSSTRIAFPSCATRIEAVSWDGKHTLVCGERPK